MDSAVRAPDAGDADQLPEGATLRFAEETVEEVPVLAYREVGQQHHRGAGLGQVVDRTHRRIDLVTNAMYVDEKLGRVLGQ